jgi:hypothetical protein
VSGRCDECGRRFWAPDVTVRWVPGHVWVRLALSRKAEPGHRWMYSGIIRRDTFTVRGWGLVVMRMPVTELTRRALGARRTVDVQPGRARITSADGTTYEAPVTSEPRPLRCDPEAGFHVTPHRGCILR